MNRGLISGIKQLFIPSSLGGGDAANDGALLGFDSTQPGGVKPVPTGTYVSSTTQRQSADLNSVNFTSTGFGAQADITGLTVTTPANLPKSRADIKLRVRANSSAAGTNAIYIVVTPAPTLGQPTASAVQVGTAGADQEFVVMNDVILAANTAYTIKAQFFQGTSGTFTVQGSPQNTELTVSMLGPVA